MFYGTFMRIDPTKPDSYRLRVMAQKAFFNGARNHPKVEFHKGHFSGAGKEKGVDVRLAVDMAIGAATDGYGEAAIMTGDADLQYAVEKAKEFGKAVHLVALGSRFPFGIAPLADRRLVYDVGGFFRENVLPSYRGKPKGVLVRELLGSIKVRKVE